MEPLQEAALVVGTKQVLRSVELSELSRVYIAKDADSALQRKIRAACEKANIEMLEVQSMSELGQWCCIDVGAACAGMKK